MPSHDGSLDSDSVQAEMLALGQEEYKELFPNAVWPSNVTQDVPLSVMINGGVAVNLPNSDPKKEIGNTFTWSGIAQEFHLFAAGSFNDTLTYFAEATASTEGVELEHAYLLWSDIAGPRHALNLWLGRLVAPQLTSFGNHSSYVSDMLTPTISIAQLLNPNGTFVLGHNTSDGVELNGIIAHRIDYSVGWLASQIADGVNTIPNAQDAYAHIGGKIGGMTLDGEGVDAHTVNSQRPWEDTALTLDAFVYHGASRFANPNRNTSATWTPQQTDKIDAIGGSARIQIASFAVNSGIQFERHSRPFGAAIPVANAMLGALDHSSATGYTQYNEVNYIIFPWLVPVVRTEFTRLHHRSESSASLLRVLPGLATLVRPNIKVTLSVDLETARGLPPGGLAGETDWSAASAFISPSGNKREFKAQQVNCNMAMSF